jgi:hypothetical protein
VIDILKRLKLGHGKPMTGTRWELAEHVDKDELSIGDRTYTEVIGQIRESMLRLAPGRSVTFTIKREDY